MKAVKTPIWVTVTPDQLGKIRIAAASKGLPMSQFVARVSVRAAEKILDKILVKPSA